MTQAVLSARWERPLARSAYARRYPFVMASALAAVAALALLHIGVGTVPIAPADVVAVLANQASDVVHRQVVWELRLPRNLIALTAGALLGLAGAILQTITRNPLASPSLTGVTAGAVLGAVLWLSFAPATLLVGTVLPLAALVGGLATMALVYTLSWQDGSDPARLAITGILVGAVLTSVTSLLLVLDGERIGSILLWIVGSINGRVWVHWAILWPWAAVSLPIGLLTAGLANALGLGDSIAAGLGQRVEVVRGGLFFVAALLTASAVSVVGAVAFIGLIGWHMARALVGGDARRVFPLSAVLASLILVGADLVSQSLTLQLPFGTASLRAGLPVGALTALIGAPFFLYLMLRERA